MAQTQSYYRTADGDRDEAVTDRPIVVNCAGIVASHSSFVSDRPWGRNDVYLMYLVNGALTVRLQGVSKLLRPGTFIVFAPHTPQYYSCQDDCGVEYCWVHFTGSASLTLLEECAIPLGEPVVAEPEDDIRKRFQELLATFVLPDLLQDCEAAGHLHLLLAMLGRICAGGSARLSPGPIRRSLARMNAHYAEPNPVTELAALEYMSASRYCAVFRARMGMPPKEYLIRLRLRNATELLLYTDLPVKEIARSVGYEDALYFSRLYKRRTGYSPREYRKR